MENPLLLSEVARLHQRDVAKKVAANQVKTNRPGLIKLFVTIRENLLTKLVIWRKQEKFAPDENLVLDSNL